MADTANGIVRFTGATTVAHNIVVTDSLGPSTHDNLEDLEDPSTSPPTGSDVLLTGGSCLANPSVQFKASGLASYVDSAYCFGEANIQAALGPYSDVYDATRSDLAQQADLGAGNDYYVGAAVSDYVTGDAGNDTIIGTGGNDTLDGGPDDDSLFAGPGHSDLIGGSGNDQLHGSPGGQGTFECGSGVDVLVVPATEAYTTDGQCEYIAVQPAATLKKDEQAALAALERAKTTKNKRAG